jgi:hypothetical protein
MIVESEISAPLMPKPATGIDPELVLSILRPPLKSVLGTCLASSPLTGLQIDYLRRDFP